MNKISVSAPGKLLLMGDHAVVYGYPCIVTAMSARLSVSIEEVVTGGIQVETPGVSDRRFIHQALETAASHWGNMPVNIHITTKSDFTQNYGLGSSAAVTVATIFALSRLIKKMVSPSEIFDLAYKTVLAVQGVGSGFDVAASTFGGIMVYTKGKPTQQLHADAMPLVVGYTGVKADTTTLINDVAQKRKTNSEKIDRIFAAIGQLVDQAATAVGEGDWKRVGKLMDFNQEYLRDLGVSSEKLEALISAAKRAGAYGAKLSGAGGGDCMIALAPPEKKKLIEDAISNVGGQVIHPDPIGASGVRVEIDDQHELFVVVDQSDTIIGFRTRYDCHHDPSLIHRSIGVLVFDSKGRVLLQKRSQSKDTYPGYWGLSCAGHVAKGETYEQTVIRELQEELGVSMQTTLHSKRIDKDVRETEMEVLFTAKYDGPFHPNSDEVAEVKFFDKREIAFGVASKTLQLTKAALDNLKTTGVLS